MTDKELSYLRDLHAGLALVGLLIQHPKGVDPQRITELSYMLADAMQIARTAEPLAGIVSAKPKRKSNEQN